MMRPPRDLPVPLVGKSFTVDDARAHGISRRRTRGRDLVTPWRGIRMPAAQQGDLVARCTAYALRMSPQQFFTSVTAARLLALPLPHRLVGETELHVAAIAPARPPRVRGITGHRVSAHGYRIGRLHGLPVVHPVDAWRSLSTVLSVRELVIVGDWLVKRQRPFATMDDLAEGLNRHRRQRGAQHLAAALARVRPGVDSAKETDIRCTIVDAGLPEPEVNVTIRNAFGAFLALGDLAYPQYRVLIEYDGGSHFGSDRQAYKDIDRLDAVMEEGWRVIRLNKTHAPWEVARRVRTALVAAGWAP